jgi:(5-formylfuran-3-yl)methyl phosphate synthase
MRLLVSVRSASEVVPALEGGADIIDAKEPANGSLGRVSPQILAAIARRVPGESGFSIALGDPATRAEIRNAIELAAPVSRAGETFVKLGFAGLESATTIGALLAEAVRVSSARPGLQVVAVSYADHVKAGSAPARVVAHIASDTGAAGVLLDTFGKEGRDLLSWLTPVELEDWVGGVREQGLLAGLAGSLKGASFRVACAAEPDIIGVRGAACLGGRNGRIDCRRVRELRAMMWTAVSSKQ